MTREDASRLALGVLVLSFVLSTPVVATTAIPAYFPLTTAFPGTGHDFNIEMLVNGLPPLESGLLDAITGDELTIEVISPNGSFMNTPFTLATYGFVPGPPPFAGSAQNTYVDLSTAEVVSDPKMQTSFGFPTIGSQGTVITLQVPPGLTGMDFMFQGFAFDVANQVIATSDGFLLRIR